MKFLDGISANRGKCLKELVLNTKRIQGNTKEIQRKLMQYKGNTKEIQRKYKELLSKYKGKQRKNKWNAEEFLKPMQKRSIRGSKGDP